MQASVGLPLLFAIGLISIIVIGLWFNGSARRTRERRAAFIKRYVFSQALRQKLRAKYPQLSAEEIELVFVALRQYFFACLAKNVVKRGGSVGMPSRVVDDLWHEFILMSREYAEFCNRAFGGFLHHLPEGGMKVPMHRALSTTLDALKPRGGIAPEVAVIGGIPLLFAIDKKLAIPDGFEHDADSIAAIEARRHIAQSGGSCAGGISVTTNCGASTGSGCADGGSADGGGADGGGCSGGGCGGGGCGSE